jgi:hypothetical protein
MSQIPQNINECNVITIFPMDVDCMVIHPSTLTSSDGVASLSIIGGTPPYDVIWENGIIGPVINNLSVGEYTATVTDYYGDFTVITTCILTGDTECSFDVSVENYLIPSLPDCYYTVTITGGTSIGPYTIYYDVISNNNVSELYSGGTAIDISLTTMESGVNVTIPCSSNLILVYNKLCDTIITVPVTPNIPINNFCLTFVGVEQKQFTGDGYDLNGNPTWIDGTGDCEVFWDMSIGEWRLSCLWLGYQLFSTDIVNSNPPLNGWYVAGQFLEGLEIIANEGVCVTGNTLTLDVTINQPDCECDGSITLIGGGGTPPYTYSINNGLTYVTSNIFVDLCPGEYAVIVKDDNNNTVNQNVIISEITTPVNYNLSLNTTSTIITNTTLIYEVNSLTTLNISPPIPIGTTITFDLQHLGIFENYLRPGYSDLDRTVILKKNNLPISLTNTVDSLYTLPGPPQCGVGTKQYTATTNNWLSLNITNGDTVIVETNSRVIKTTQPSQCQDGNDINIFSLSNPLITGCNCCDVEIVDRITTTTTTVNSLSLAIISTSSEPIDACSLVPEQIVWVNTTNQFGVVNVGDTIFTNSSGSTKFIGNGDYYKLETIDGGIPLSLSVNSNGIIGNFISTC